MSDSLLLCNVDWDIDCVSSDTIDNDISGDSYSLSLLPTDSPSVGSSFFAIDPKTGKYPPVVDAAKYVLMPFICVFDCNERYYRDGVPKTPAMNSSVLLNRKIFFHSNKKRLAKKGKVLTLDMLPVDPQKSKIDYLTKKKFVKHLNGETTYFYRNSYNAPYRTGYGRFDKTAQNLSFSRILGITHRVIIDWSRNVLLLGIDLDVHNGERDIELLRDMILSFFPGAYFEPSTGGKGIHVYVKIIFDPNVKGNLFSTIEYIRNLTATIAYDLDVKRESMGIEAKIDLFRSFPSVVKLFYNDEIQDYLVGYYDKSRCPCIKIPRFNSTSKHTNLNDILWFHRSPYYSLEELERIADTLQSEITSSRSIDTVQLTYDSQQINDIVDAISSIGNKLDEKKKKGDEEKRQEYPSNLKKKKRTYNQVIEELRQNTNAMSRGTLFIQAYARLLKRIPTIEEALQEYETQGINTEADVNGRRYDRFCEILQYMERDFDLDRLGADYGGFSDNFDFLVKQMGKCLVGQDLTYQQGNKRLTIKVKELACAYYSMRKLQGDHGQVEFSYGHLNSAFEQNLNCGCGRSKAQRILEILVESGWIEKLYNHQNYAGKTRGRIYRVLEIPSIDKPEKELDTR